VRSTHAHMPSPLSPPWSPPTIATAQHISKHQKRQRQMRPKTTRGSSHESTELLATCACKRITLSVPPLATPHAHRAAHGVRARPLLSISPTRRARCLHLRCQRHAQGSDSGQSEHPNHVVHLDLTIRDSNTRQTAPTPCARTAQRGTSTCEPRRVAKVKGRRRLCVPHTRHT
jgi:hypothetical protein